MYLTQPLRLFQISIRAHSYYNPAITCFSSKFSLEEIGIQNVAIGKVAGEAKNAAAISA